ncbi:MAG: endonuclease/exonuclease/phosphatase family protein [Betaproteobacteria bacterium]|nr:endonuclease/exonuclease/phosphatase family protein [Betaproteobacteria bacterium]
MSTFKVLQFNMQFGRRWDNGDPDHAPIDLELTIADIRGHDADVILLQEVEQVQLDGAQRIPPPNYLRLCVELGGYEGFFSYPKTDLRELPFGVGLAIFSKASLRNTIRKDLPSPPIQFEFNGKCTTPTDRLLIGATTTLAGHELRIYNTHLLAFFMLNSSSEKYNGQRALVLDQLRTSQGPTLIGGDFNVSQHESLVRQFGGAGFRTVQMNEATWRRRPLVLDHIFYSRHFRLVRHSVVPTSASDHHILKAELEFVD